MSLDYLIFQYLNNLAGHYRAIEYLAIFFGNYFPWMLGVVLVFFIFLGKNKEEKKKNYIMVAVAFTSAVISRFVFTQVIWFSYFRPRPFVFHSVFQYISPMTNNSFPSGHAAFFFGLATVVYLFNKKIGYWFLTGAFLISIARIFAGIHYPSDILVGAAIGIFTGWVFVRCLKILRIEEKSF